jgi:hypothetical protein
MKGIMSHSIGRPKKVTLAQIEQARTLYAANEFPVKEIMKLTGFTNYATFHHSVIKGTISHSIGRRRKVTQAQLEQASFL